MSILLLIYVGFGLILALAQRKLIYHPTAPTQHPYETILLPQGNATIALLRVPPHDNTSDTTDIAADKENDAASPAVIYFGGNAETVAWLGPDLSRAIPNATIYLVNYRGYGESTGSPTEKALCADALSIYKHVAQQHDSISLMGRSLGSGIATHVAARRPVDKLILVTPYDSIHSVAQHRFFMYPMFLLLRDTYLSIKNVPHITAPTMILVAESDDIIPTRHSTRLAEAFQARPIATSAAATTAPNSDASSAAQSKATNTSPDEQPRTIVHTIASTDHNSISEHPSYNHHISTFMAGDD